VPRDYDLAVIGAGSAGLVAARLAAGLGLRAALVERDRVGGDCTWTGCIPSKALLHAARVADLVRRGPEVGVMARRVTVDFARVMAHVKAAIERVYALETPESLARLGIDVLNGSARFLDPSTIEVGSETIRARCFLICTGAEPEIPKIPGLETVPSLTHERFFDLERQPASMMVIGSGAVGCELGQALSRLGTRVTMVEQASRILPVADPEASRLLAEQFAEEGIAVRTGVKVERVGTGRRGVEVVVDGESVKAESLLVATGRRPRTEGLDLDKAGVAHDASGIAVDSRLRTSQPHIYAAGDVTGAFQFTHYAGWQGFLAVRNAFLPGGQTGTREHIPWVVFTDPEVAQAGRADDGGDVRVDRLPLEAIDRAQTRSERRGLVKVSSRDGCIVGATLVLSEAGELINELAVAIDNRIKLVDLGRTIHAYPTYGTAVQQLAARLALERSMSGWRGRLLRALR
jgi:pyruvate/2-oxoglutarate dehydrogenase complex dihydrolipoamide dehydrogenase (E3) component